MMEIYFYKGDDNTLANIKGKPENESGESQESADLKAKTKKLQESFLKVLDNKNLSFLLGSGCSSYKIENEGFNNQKNIRYNIEHTNSHNYTAMKNHYILTQIADIIMQLFENGLKILKVVKKTAKAMSSNLLEAIRTRRLTVEDILHMANPIQIRFT